MFHQQLQIKTSGTQGFQCAVAGNGVNKILNAGQVRTVNQKHLFVIKPLFVLHPGNIRDMPGIEILCNAAAQGGGQPAVVEQGDVRRRGEGGGDIGKFFFHTFQQGVQMPLVQLKIRQARPDGLQALDIERLAAYGILHRIIDFF